jgi:hypothetical protein
MRRATSWIISCSSVKEKSTRMPSGSWISLPL